MKFLIIIAILVLPTLCCADNANNRAYSGTTLDVMCRSLNVTSDQFVQCYDQSITAVITPYVDQPAGGNTDLLTCLQQYNANLTEDQLNSALAKYRPIIPNTGSQ